MVDRSSTMRLLKKLRDTSTVNRLTGAVAANHARDVALKKSRRYAAASQNDPVISSETGVRLRCYELPP